MNRNQLKIIACISMLVDHIGYVLFPDIEIFRLIGRIAMPVFAFFIGEGCLYTKDKKKYFLRVFLLGLLCQAVYIAESFISGSDSGAYMNILLTFSLSILLCYSFLYSLSSLKDKDKSKKIKGVFTFAAVFGAVSKLCLFCEHSFTLTGIKFEFDYGIYGICLPLFAAITKNKSVKLICFGTALAVSALALYDSAAFALCAFSSLALLAFYNGRNGKTNLKYFFYAFYPTHLAAIYLIDLLI